MQVRLVNTGGPWVSQAGSLAPASAVVTGLADTSTLIAGQAVAGKGVPADTLIASVDSATQVTITRPSSVRAPSTPTLRFGLEPLTLAAAKSHLRVDFADDDPLIAGLITSARRLCETYLSQALITQTFRLYLDQFPWGGGYWNRVIRQMGPMPYWLPSNTGILHLFRPPLQSVQSIQYVDTSGVLQTIDPSMYTVSGEPTPAGELATECRLQPVYGRVWPVARPQIDGVVISYTSGYGDTPDDVPANVTQAMKLLVGHLYYHRGDDDAGVPDAVALVLSASEHGAYA